MAFNFWKKSTKEPKPPKTAMVTPVEETTPAAGLAAPAPMGTILKRYYVSEKSTRGFALNQYTFEVDRRATKTQVRDAVERGYNVDVVAVNIIRLPVKKIQLGRFRGSKGGIKKAIVTLKEGQAIAQAQP